MILLLLATVSISPPILFCACGLRGVSFGGGSFGFLRLLVLVALALAGLAFAFAATTFAFALGGRV